MGRPLGLSPCGTCAGYRRHRKAAEPPCEACLAANRAYMKDWYERNPNKEQEYRSRRATKPKRKTTVQERRASKLKSRYGLTATQWEELFEWQGRACACCGTQEEYDRQKPWQVDHDHVTGAIRGILCSRCNRLLAQLGDDAEGVAASVTRILAYLHAAGDMLTDAQIEQVVDAIRGHRGLVGEGSADPTRSPLPRHEADGEPEPDAA